MDVILAGSLLFQYKMLCMLSTSACALCLGALSRRPKNAVKIIRIGLSGTKKIACGAAGSRRYAPDALRALPSSIPRMCHLSAALIRILITPPTGLLASQLHSKRLSNRKSCIASRLHELPRFKRSNLVYFILAGSLHFQFKMQLPLCSV